MDSLYQLSLPYVIFVMQSVGFALTYGKRQTAERMGITGPTLPRDVEVAAMTEDVLTRIYGARQTMAVAEDPPLRSGVGGK